MKFKIKNLKLKIARSAGFSLVELLVVITIIAILSVVAYTALGGQTEKARNARRQSDLSTIQSALEIYFIEHNNKYPSELDDGSLVSTDIDLVPKYMPKMALDPTTGQKYDYKTNGTFKKYQLAATLEDDSLVSELGVKAYVVGNSTTNIMSGLGLIPANLPTETSCTVNGLDPTNGYDEDCIPYKL